MLSESERRKLTLEYADLIKEEEACSTQYRSTIDDAQKVILKRKLDDYQQKLTNLENRLYGEDSVNEANLNRRFCAIEQKLSKIDFKKQKKIIENILEDFLEYGNAIFFVNDSLYMAGELFSKEIKKILEEETTDLKYYPIAFTIGGSLDEVGFLQALAGHLGIEAIHTKDDYDSISKKINHSIENGSIIFIELNKIDLLDKKDSFLCWLLNDFCKFLNNNLIKTCHDKKIGFVRFIVLVSSDDYILDDLEECNGLDIFCDGEEFSESQIFPITLSHWSEQDIDTWLQKHSGLPTNQILSMSKSIHRSSRGGTPKLICEALRSKLS
ncbi:hypothetical protein [Calothrix sp. 336/3]|uniref:hypothetical protein n=1 Tax=Calothrix sp. 336/3 TaxID=1337936 RepID=UPI0004E34AA0|nr:hypothetical protein [Calothrix sp. 336/3]AKG20139.1 hypothetical protein IJ00_01380 [Calothrix sp. 336/3]